MENSELIIKALNYVKGSCGDADISVDQVAFNAGFSTDYFNRIFAAHTGFNVMEYVRFVRLRKASLMLRTSERSVLDIALDCGYDSHESFSRAFKNQYGISPSEYREKMKGDEPLYSEYHNETVGARLLHEFSSLKSASADDAIDFLLEKDGVKYGYVAVTLSVNGGAVLYSGDSLNDGFVIASEEDGRYKAEIIADSYDAVAEYCKLFSDERFIKAVYTLDSEEKILSELSKRGVKAEKITVSEHNIYKGEKYKLKAPDGISARQLSYGDFDLIEKYYIEKEGSLKNWRKAFLAHIKQDLKAKSEKPDGKHSVFIFGIFKGEKLIGVSLGALQGIRGLLVNQRTPIRTRF